MCCNGTGESISLPFLSKIYKFTLKQILNTMKIDFENFLSKPIEEKVRNPFFLALIFSIFSYNKKFIFTVFLPAEDWNERWTLLGKEWMSAVWWCDYPLVIGLALVYTVGFYLAAYVTYIIATFYEKQAKPWIGNLIFKKGYEPRDKYLELDGRYNSQTEKLNKTLKDLTDERETNEELNKVIDRLPEYASKMVDQQKESIKGHLNKNHPLQSDLHEIETRDLNLKVMDEIEPFLNRLKSDFEKDAIMKNEPD